MEDRIEACVREVARHRPDLIFAARRCAVQDANFRGICDDYAEATRAAHAAEVAVPPETERAAEFRKMARELIEEALGHLTTATNPQDG